MRKLTCPVAMSFVGAVQDTPSVYLCAVVPRSVRRELRLRLVAIQPTNVTSLGTCTAITFRFQKF